MNRLFASYLAEDVVPVEVSGAYDPEQQLWVGNALPLAANGTEDGGTGTTLYCLEGTSTWFGDSDTTTDIGYDADA